MSKKEMNLSDLISLENILNFYCKTSATKEETFLKGYLLGLGSHNACPTPLWKVMKGLPEFVEVEREMREMYEEIHKKNIEEARRLLLKQK